MIKAKLELARKDLIDTGLRNNPLLNFKIPKAKGVMVHHGIAAQVHRLLVIDAKSLSFAPYTYAGTGMVLRTPYESEVLEKRLLKTFYDARTCIEERGVNLLYLAVGMVHWFEDGASEAELSAPALLIPVTMTRSNTSDTFTIAYSNEDVEGNLPLATRMAELGMALPNLPEDDELDVDAYFDSIEASIQGKPRWRLVRDEIALGLFSFANTFMYRDLNPDVWCTEENPSGSPIIAGLLGEGFGSDRPTVSEEAYLDKYVAPDVLHQVVDADSSQALAMLEVKQGRNLVIQGPPGTGKSQTITNIIADAVGAGKKVLFVAEKSAALDVVKRRLTKVGLGDLCLELHSHTANKKSLLLELRRTHELAPPRPSSSWSVDNYKRYRDDLNEYCLALNTPVGGTHWTPQQLMGALAAIRARHDNADLPNAQLSLVDIAWSNAEFERKRNLVYRVANLLRNVGEPTNNPFHGAHVAALLPSDQDELLKFLREALAICVTLRTDMTRLSEVLGVETCRSPDEVQLLLDTLQRASSAPDIRSMEPSLPTWSHKSSEVLQLIQMGKALSERRSMIISIVKSDFWDQDHSEVYRVYQRYGSVWYRWMVGDYRRAKSTFSTMLVDPKSYDARNAIEILRTIDEYRGVRQTLQGADRVLSDLLGEHWRGMQSSWTPLEDCVQWIDGFVRSGTVNQYDEAVFTFLVRNGSATATLRSYEVGIKQHRTSLEQLLIQINRRIRYEDASVLSVFSEDISNLEGRLSTLVNNFDQLQKMIRWNSERHNLVDEGLSWLPEFIEQKKASADNLEDVFVFNALMPQLRAAHDERKSLRTNDGTVLDACRESFSSLDVGSFTATRDRLLQSHYRGIPRLTEQGQVGTLAREYNKKRRFLPIRKLIEQAHAVIQAMKPVFMMSPKSIAAFLPANTIAFDLVVFDEASQIRPVDAFGALIRAKQFVVVGDSKQLPPTNFFNRMLDDDIESDDYESSTSDIESLLGLASSMGVPQRMLRWHYRSRHDSLISLSNQWFYDHKLIVFPSPKGKRSDLGLVLRHMPESVYDRGKTRTNQVEAEAVARAVLLHARERPDKTLGVATFNSQQADAILNQLEVLRRQQPDLESFFQSHPDEPFFCKSLENVQGDERDVIIISIGYGRDKDTYLSMTFGALNKDGGERRLNVLITRARECCVVYSNITSTDIDDSRSKSQGLSALKAFLQYAEHGVIDIPSSGTGEVESPFEEEVVRSLEQRGYGVECQVGSAGFRIDIAIKDPSNPSNYLLGIECDGATYHRSRTARDRDRLRQQVLENMGWRIHRVWSTDWYQNAKRELEKIVSIIEQLQSQGDVMAVGTRYQPQMVQHRQTSVLDVQRVENSASKVATQSIVGTPYVLAAPVVRLRGRELHEVRTAEMITWIESVVEVESPVASSDVISRIANAGGVARVGSRILSTYEQALATAVRNGVVSEHHGFVYSQKKTEIVVRDRSALEPSQKRFSNIPPEEIDAAIVLVIRETFGIVQTDIGTNVARALGVMRTTKETQKIISNRLKILIEDQRIVIANNQYQLGRS